MLWFSFAFSDLNIMQGNGMEDVHTILSLSFSNQLCT